MKLVSQTNCAGIVSRSFLNQGDVRDIRDNKSVIVNSCIVLDYHALHFLQFQMLTS